MKEYRLFAESYRKAAEQGNLGKEEAEKIARAYDFLADCDPEDLFNIYAASGKGISRRRHHRRRAREGN